MYKMKHIQHLPITDLEKYTDLEKDFDKVQWGELIGIEKKRKKCLK